MQEITQRESSLSCLTTSKLKEPYKTASLIFLFAPSSIVNQKRACTANCNKIDKKQLKNLNLIKQLGLRHNMRKSNKNIKQSVSAYPMMIIKIGSIG